MNLNQYKLGDLLDVKRGASLSGDYYSKSGKLVRLTLGNFNYPGGGFKENTSKEDIYFIGPIRDEFVMKKGDIITPLTEQVRGLLGETAVIPEDDKYIQSGDVGKVIPFENVLDRSFAKYLISSPLVKYQLDSAAQQTKIRHTSPDKIKDCVVFIPSLGHQKKAGKLLDFINAKIENNKKISSELEGLAKTIYDYWFLQFEFPNEDGKPYKSSGGKMVYSEELKREIPEGWDVKSLPECADLQYGYPLSVDLFGKEGNPVIRIRDILDNTISAYTSEQVSENYKTHEGDLLVGMDGNFQMNYWPENNDIVNQRITRIRKKDIPLLIVRNQIEPYILAKIESVARSTVGHLSDSDFKNQPILIPKNLNCNCFDNWLNAIIHFRKENKQLASLRDWLLPMLMNGQVAFKESL